jgi:hypothetical protein
LTPREGPAALERGALEALERAPPLAHLAAVMALSDLILNRIAPLAVNMIADDRSVAVHLLRYGTLPRNAAAVAGVIALAAALFGFLRMAGWASLFRRLQVAGLAGLLFPALLLGLLLPKERVPAPVVLVAVGVGHALVALFGVTVLPYRSAAARRASLAASLTSALVLTLLVAASLEGIQRFLETPDSLVAKAVWATMAGSRLLGELVWCSVPWIALLPGLRRLLSERRVRVAFLALALVALVASVIAELKLHPSYSIVAYSAFRLTFLPERWSGLYGLAALLALALAAAGLLSERPLVRQHASAVLLWIACGFAPRSLSQVLYFVLGAAMLSRVAQASDPEGRRRALLPWGAPREPSPIPEDLR